MILSCKYHQDLGDFESVVAKKLNSAMNKKEKKEMSDYAKFSEHLKERRERNLNDFQKRVINDIDAWAKSRPYSCSVIMQHTFSSNSINAEPEIERTSLFFSPCGHIEICWDGCRHVSITVDTIIQHISEEHSKYFGRAQQNRDRAVPEIEKVIFNYPATIIFWKDGTKTVVKCDEDDEFNPEVGMAMAISKKALGNKGNYCNEFKKWVEPYWSDVKEKMCAICRYKELLGTSKPCCECDSDYGRWEPKIEDVSEAKEESESLKGVRIGKAIGEGLVAGMKESNDAPEAKEKSDVRRRCINCKFEFYSGNEEPCYSCRIPHEHNNWTPKD